MSGSLRSKISVTDAVDSGSSKNVYGFSTPG
jgi:hypothetical protein